MFALLRTRRWQGFTALVLLAIIAFGLLSNWQWHRAAEERTARISLLEQTAASPLTLDEALDRIGGMSREDISDLWLPVDVTGGYRAEDTVLVRQRPLDGRNGFWVVTPLQVSGDRVLWVNRGWIPAEGGATTIVTPPPSPAGQVRVAGWLRPTEPTREVITDLPPGQVRWLDTQALSADAGFRPDADPGVYLERTTSQPGDPGVIALPLPVIDEVQNISYAVQWILFALVAISGWVFFLRREAREDSAVVASPDGSSTPGDPGAGTVDHSAN